MNASRNLRLWPCVWTQSKDELCSLTPKSLTSRSTSCLNIVKVVKIETRPDTRPSERQYLLLGTGSHFCLNTRFNPVSHSIYTPTSSVHFVHRTRARGCLCEYIPNAPYISCNLSFMLFEQIASLRDELDATWVKCIYLDYCSDPTRWRTDVLEESECCDQVRSCCLISLSFLFSRASGSIWSSLQTL